MKELGFNEECFACYLDDGFLCKDFTRGQDHFAGQQASAPLWQQAFDWFRKRHNLYIKPLNVWEIEGEIDYIETKPTGWFVDMFMYYSDFSLDNAEIYPTYEEAREACLIELIKLIEEKK